MEKFSSNEIEETKIDETKESEVEVEEIIDETKESEVEVEEIFDYEKPEGFDEEKEFDKLDDNERLRIKEYRSIFSNLKGLFNKELSAKEFAKNMFETIQSLRLHEVAFNLLKENIHLVKTGTVKMLEKFGFGELVEQTNEIIDNIVEMFTDGVTEEKIEVLSGVIGLIIGKLTKPQIGVTSTIILRELGKVIVKTMKGTGEKGAEIIKEDARKYDADFKKYASEVS